MTTTTEPTLGRSTTAPAIECLDIRKTFAGRGGREERVVLDGASFTATEGEFVCILGPSGCGKSTFLNILSGLDRKFSGTARVQGIPVDDPRMSTVRSAYIFQESRLLPWRTVAGNIEFVLRANGFAPDEFRDRIDSQLEAVGLLEFRDFHPHELSGGMQQRASIARAFAIEPDVLYMDEPFSALDELTARKLRGDLLELWEARRSTVVFVTHNAFEATFLADRILIMQRGPASTFRDEIRLDGLVRPRGADSSDVFEMSREVVNRLVGIVGLTTD